MNVYLLNAETLTGIQAYYTGKFLETASLRNVTNPRKKDIKIRHWRIPPRNNPAGPLYRIAVVDKCFPSGIDLHLTFSYVAHS